MKLVNEMTFEEKMYLALEDLDAFSSSCKEIHDTSCCKADHCFNKFFCDELSYYTNIKNREVYAKKKLLF